jgi:hypothetical protein
MAANGKTMMTGADKGPAQRANLARLIIAGAMFTLLVLQFFASTAACCVEAGTDTSVPAGLMSLARSV